MIVFEIEKAGTGWGPGRLVASPTGAASSEANGCGFPSASESGKKGGESSSTGGDQDRSLGPTCGHGGGKGSPQAVAEGGHKRRRGDEGYLQTVLIRVDFNFRLSMDSVFGPDGQLGQ